MSRFSTSKKISQAFIVSTLFTLGLNQTHAAVPIIQGSLSGGNISNNINNPQQNGANQAEDTQGSTLWKLYQQVQQLQQEIRELRGQLEAQQNGLDRTQKDLKNRYTDLDQRLESLREQSEGTDAESEAPTDTPSNDADSNKSNNSTTPPVKTPAQPTPTQPPSKANLYVQQPAASADADKNAYIGAYDAYKSGGAAKAIKPMQQFIVDFPNSVYVPNAYYWLGEFHLASNPADFNKAKKSFNEVITKYPKSAKASTALYRIATITQEIDKRPQEALALMKKLSQNYPNSTESQYANSFIKSYKK